MRSLAFHAVTSSAFALALAAAGCHAPARPDPARPFAATWQPLNTGTRAQLRGLSVVDARTLWLSGSGGTVLRSIDGGAHFAVRRVQGAEAADIRDIHGFDAEHAVCLACQPAALFHTSDGGVSFVCTYRAADPRAFLDAIAFFDAQHGLAFGDPVDGRPHVLRTEDGGRTWQAVPAAHLPAPLPGEGGFAASGTCLVAHPSGRAWIGTGIASARVLVSNDSGKSFAAVATPLRAGPAAGIFSLAFRNSDVGVVVGGDYQHERRVGENAACTRDGGKTWSAAQVPPAGYRSCAAFLPGAEVWIAVGPSGTDVSRDDGATWSALDPAGYHVVSAARDGTCFAAGAAGRAARLVPRQ
ncbi:MAG: oxidoreductase [Planctomycetes bacterium]|nr:oxidoreductase [Planctomycetota bacterium]MCB9889197.1 oxidoreductase [Planctomycetota bacterium]